MLFCTINDFLGYGNLNGYSVKGHRTCPVCEENTSYHQLKHGRKTCYIGHRRILKHNHPYRRLKKAFNGCQEDKTTPPPLTSEQVYNRVCQVEVMYVKTLKHNGVKNIWKRKSIFFELPYWSKLDVRHCIDVMHVEKNVCDRIIGTLLNIKGKTKDGINARRDLVEMGVRLELKPQPHGKRTYLPPTYHMKQVVQRFDLINVKFCFYILEVTNFLDFSAINVCNVLGRRSTTTFQNFRWIFPKVLNSTYNSKFNLLKSLLDLFNDLCIMKVQQATT